MLESVQIRRLRLAHLMEERRIGKQNTLMEAEKGRLAKRSVDQLRIDAR